MNLNELDQYLELINSVLLKSAVKINKWREKFMLEVLLLYLIIPAFSFKKYCSSLVIAVKIPIFAYSDAEAPH